MNILCRNNILRRNNKQDNQKKNYAMHEQLATCKPHGTFKICRLAREREKMGQGGVMCRMRTRRNDAKLALVSLMRSEGSRNGVAISFINFDN